MSKYIQRALNLLTYLTCYCVKKVSKLKMKGQWKLPCKHAQLSPLSGPGSAMCLHYTFDQLGRTPQQEVGQIWPGAEHA